MSMRENPGSGHAVALTAILQWMANTQPVDVRQRIEAANEDRDYETLREELNPILEQAGMPTVEDIATLDEAFTSPDLQTGETYALFAESDLYIQAATKAHRQLLNAGIQPAKAHWTIFG